MTCTLTINVIGQPPINAVYDWGDGAKTYQTLNNGSSNQVQMSHIYTVKGNYTLKANISDAANAVWYSQFKVSAWVASYFGTSGITASIEGQGFVPSLGKQINGRNRIVAYVYNSGSNYFGPLAVTWYAGDWSHSCALGSEGINALVPGERAYFSMAFEFTCLNLEGRTPIWVKVTSSNVPALNATSPQMPIVWSSNAMNVTYSVVPSVSSLTINQGGSGLVQYFIVNTGSASLALSPVESQNPSGTLFTMPSDLGNPSNLLMIQGQTQPAVAGNVALFQRAGRLVLQPGESFTVNQTISALGPANTVLTEHFYGECLGYNGAASPFASCDNSVSNFPNQPIVTVNVIVSPIGASIRMIDAINMANGTVQFVGMVTSMGPQTGGIPVWFVFEEVNTTTPFQTNQQTIYAVGTVTQIVTGLKTGTNYTVYMATLLPQNGGLTTTSNVITFRTLGAGQNPTSPPPSSFTGTFLFFLGQATGIPPEIFGFLFGAAMVFFSILVLILIAARGHVEIPASIYLGLMLIDVIVNTLLFLWPSFVIAIMVVALGLMLWHELGGGFGQGGETRG